MLLEATRGQGVASSFAFAVGFGSILSVLQAMQIGIELVTPAAWKRALGLSADKQASLHKARLLFPAADLRLAKHDGRAEALLLAHWALLKQHSPANSVTIEVACRKLKRKQVWKVLLVPLAVPPASDRRS